MLQEGTQAYHIVAYEFAGRRRAVEVIDLIRKAGGSHHYKVTAWAVVEVDDNGQAHVSQSGHGGMGTAVGSAAGALLGLIGGPAGLLVWTLGGALVGGLAGKFMGRYFDEEELKAMTAGMGPNASAIIVIVQDTLMAGMAGALDKYGAKVVTVTLSSHLLGEMATYEAIGLGENTKMTRHGLLLA